MDAVPRHPRSHATPVRALGLAAPLVAAASAAWAHAFPDRAFSGMEFVDYIPATLKTIVFGFIIGTVSSYLGYNAEGGAEGVGRASTKSVVFSSILLILANVVLVKMILFLFPDQVR